MTNNQVTLSIVIKALNEEAKIAATIESALRSISKISGEVILADSHSTDRTIEIASRFPIRIVKLGNPEEKCCGVGGQLGYQIALGTYVWIVDGDMELFDGFAEQAIHSLEADPRLAGVGGRVVEKNLESLEFRQRVSKAAAHMQPSMVDRLDMGGVYRRAAIESVGYFTNLNLHAYEEYELAARLRSKGWLLRRIAADAVSHFGHQDEAFSLLRKRWKSGYVRGIGELLRSSIGKEHFSLVIREVRELRLYALVVLWWLALIVLMSIGWLWPGQGDAIPMAIALALVPLIVMSIRKRSFHDAIYSVVSWNYYAAGIVLGLLTPQRSPRGKVDCIIVPTVLDEEISGGRQCV